MVAVIYAPSTHKWNAMTPKRMGIMLCQPFHECNLTPGVRLGGDKIAQSLCSALPLSRRILLSN